MLPKRSTPVDQNFLSENTHSQLSVAIFIASRNLLGARESLIYKKKSQNGKTQKQPPPLVIFLRDINKYRIRKFVMNLYIIYFIIHCEYIDNKCCKI